MYTARILMVLDLLHNATVPTDFTWNVLLCKVDWDESDKDILTHLRAIKVATVENSPGVPEAARDLLTTMIERVREKVSAPDKQSDDPQWLGTSNPMLRRDILPALWDEWSGLGRDSTLE